MERLTIPDVRVDEHTTRRSFIDASAVQEHAMEIYHRLKIYEDMAELCGGIDRLRELAETDKDGRCVVLPCKYDERWADEDGRIVRITATTADVDSFGTHTTVYFTYEDATSCDDADSDCTANWDYFGRRFTRAEAERVLEGRKDGN